MIEITKLYLQNTRIALEAPNIKRELRVIRRWGHGPRDDSQSHCSRGRDIRGGLVRSWGISTVNSTGEYPAGGSGSRESRWGDPEILNSEDRRAGRRSLEEYESRQRLNREDQRPMA